MPANLIRQTRAHHSETVEIRWTLQGGATYYQRVRVPPRTVREAHPENFRAEGEALPTRVVGSRGG